MGEEIMISPSLRLKKSLYLCVFVFKIKNITTMKKETWKTIIQIIVTVLSTILGTSVLQSCM